MNNYFYEHQQNSFNRQLHLHHSTQSRYDVWFWFSEENKSVQICKWAEISATLVQSSDQSKRFPTLVTCTHSHTDTQIRNFVFLYVAQGITGDSIHQSPDHWLISSQIFQPFLFYIYRQRLVQFSIESFERCCFSGGLVEYLTQLLLAAMEAAMVRVLHSASMLQLVLQCVLERFLTLQMLSRPQICSVLGCLTRKGGEEKAFVAFSDSADNFPQSTSS